MKPKDIWKTAVMTPFGLYEWIVMPMGLQNVPLIHQCCVTAALWHLIGKICHVYVDDVMIWSKSIVDHKQDICLVLRALHEAGLYLNPRKCQFYCTEINFLGHTSQPEELKPTSWKLIEYRIGQFQNLPWTFICFSDWCGFSDWCSTSWYICQT